MATIVDPARERAMREWLDAEFLKHRRDPKARPHGNEVAIGSDWHLRASAPMTPLLRRTLANVRRFARRCLGLSFSGAGQGAVLLELDPSRAGGKEDFHLAVRPGEVRVTANDELGLLRGAMRVLRTCANRRAPFLPRGAREWSPAFSPRIVNTVFCPAAQTLKDSRRQFSDGCLSLMSFFDVSGVHVYLNLWEHCRSRTLPVLNHPSCAANLAALQAFCERAAEFGVSVYPVLNAPSLPAGHPVFRQHPSTRGARTFMGEIFANGHALCASSGRVRSFFGEAVSNLFSAVPRLGGVILLVGGESFMHCYTRPAPPFTGRTNCPRCAKADPSRRVAQLVNRIASAVHAKRPKAKVFCWPYSAFTWSGEDRSQLGLVRHLADDVSFLSNWDSGDRHPATGAALYDYNLVELGPSSQFAAQGRALSARRRPHFAKFEGSTDPLMFQLPYLPVHLRWAEKARRMRREKVAGYISHWRFYGFTGSLPEEILAESAWRAEPPATVLRRYCLREFGEFSTSMLRGWREMGRAWEQIPYSACLVGERQFYMKGPMYLGPAHPFIFDPQNHYGLSRGFIKLRGDGAEAFGEQSFMESERLHGAPAYSSDLAWTLPMGVDRACSMLERAASTWEKGVGLLDRGFRRPNAAARREIGLARIVGIHLRSALHLGRFYRLRDRLLAGGLRGPSELAATVRKLQAILAAEIANAESAIPILENDPRVGYGFCYGIVYDARMVREKIAQCRHVMEGEIPSFAKDLRFHLYSIFP